MKVFFKKGGNHAHNPSVGEAKTGVRGSQEPMTKKCHFPPLVVANIF